MGPPEFIIIGIVAIVVLFGAKKAPEIARSLGRSQSEFKKGLREGQRDLADDERSSAPDAPAQTKAEPPPPPPPPSTS